MRELSLFSGAGGGLLGTLLLGWRPVGYVEFNDYCQRVIRQRIADGILPNAPIFGDVRTFLSEGYAAAYTGLVDVVTGGFPCQPFSVAGKRAGADDPRNMWPATIATIRTVRPRYAFLENVPGLLASGYFGTILGDLAQSGYDARWRILSAAELGAPHKRDRLWIVAHDNSVQRELHEPSIKRQVWVGHDFDRGSSAICDMANADRTRLRSGDSLYASDDQEWHAAPHGEVGQDQPRQFGQDSKVLGDTNDTRLSQPEYQREHARPITQPSWWATEPDMGRVANGVASRVDRLKALGNGQVSIVAATAWHLLSQELKVQSPSIT